MAVGRMNYGLLGDIDAPMYGRRNTIGRIPQNLTRETVAGGGGPDPVDPRLAPSSGPKPGMTWDDFARQANQGYGMNFSLEEPARFAREFAQMTGFQGDPLTRQQWTPPADMDPQVAAAEATMQGWTTSPEFQKHLQNYQYTPTTLPGKNQHPGVVVADQSGQRVGEFNTADNGSRSVDAAMKAAVAAIAAAGIGSNMGLLGDAAPAGGLGGGGSAPFGALEGMGAVGGAEALPAVALDASMIPSMPAIQGGAELGASGLNAMRAGELAGYSSAPGAVVTAATPASGGLLSQITAGLGPVGEALKPIGSAIGGAADWMKDNPMLGKLLMSGGGALLSGMGGGQSGGPAPMPTGPAKQWSSGLQQGIMTQPTPQRQGLLGPVQGMGAARWLRGG